MTTVDSDRAEGSLPTKSNAYLAAESIFYEQYNDVHFFIEDAHCENLYYEILSKFFPSLRIDKIFPLGGKSVVIAQAKEKQTRKIKHVYIVDLDFDGLLNRYEVVDGLFYIQKFCIENYLLDQQAWESALRVFLPKERSDNVLRELKLTEKITDYIIHFQEFYTLALLVSKHSLSLPTVGNRYAKYVDKNCQLNSNAKEIQKLRREIAAQLKSKVEDFDRYYDQHESMVARNPDNYSGKHIMDALLSTCTSGTPFENQRDSACVLLAQHCKLSDFKPVIELIKEYLSGHKRMMPA